jgi:lambda family phage portal protein
MISAPPAKPRIRVPCGSSRVPAPQAAVGSNNDLPQDGNFGGEATVGRVLNAQHRGSLYAYDAASRHSQEMADWWAWIRSPDSETTPYRDRMVARNRDVVRNDGWASGGVMRILDNTVGANLRLSAQPDYRYLALLGGSAYDVVWSEEFRSAAEAYWRSYSENIGRWNDRACALTTGAQFRLAMRHKLVDGEALGVNFWLPDRVGPGAADFATTLELVDPDRLSNPNDMVDTKYLRGGVEINDDGASIAHHIREAHQNDIYNAVESMRWERVVDRDDDGWIRVEHDFERDRVGQHRGIGVFTPVLARMKMLARYYGVELQAAVVQATLGLFVTTPFDKELLADAVTGGRSPMERYLGFRGMWRDENPAMFNGVVIPTLSPGETITPVQASHPHEAFEAFTHEMLRTIAAALGVSAEQITQDWSKTNYSSARAALLESWKTLVRRRAEFARGFATPFYAMWLWEAFDLGLLPLPRNVIPFRDAMTAYARCRWLGPGRGWIDPVKERQGSVLGMDACLSTMEDELADNSGKEVEEVLDQRAREMMMFKERGLTPPSWASMQTATEAAQPPAEPIAA